MASNFQSWEKDPFFFAAEQVQDSADRLESAYRAWIHAKSLSEDNSATECCRRALSTALGIAKWQLEEFEKEVLSLCMETPQQQEQHAEDDAPQRHRQFIDAISNQLISIKNALLCSKDESYSKVLPTVCLGQQENDDFANFLCGSRISTGDDAKDILGSCTRLGKAYKEVATSCQSASPLTSDSGSSVSGLGYEKALFGSLDECFSPHETRKSADTNLTSLPYDTCFSKSHIANRPESQGAIVKDTDFICIALDQSDDNATCVASGLLLGDCYDNVRTCIERPNGHHRSTSLGGGLSCCTERANGHQRTVSGGVGLTNDYKASHKQVTSSPTSNIWSSLLKASLIFRSGVSQDGLKRWKDGEGDAIDLCGISDSNIEANCSSFLCQDGKRYRGCSETLQTFQSSRKAVSTQRLIQATYAVLAAIVLLVLYFH